MACRDEEILVTSGLTPGAHAYVLFFYLVEVVGAFCKLWSQEVLAPVNSELCSERLQGGLETCVSGV